MSHKLTPKVLSDAIAGDFEALALVLQQSHSQIQESRSHLDEVVVNRAMIRNVLRGLEQRRVPPHLVQQWASFVRRGYVAAPAGGSVAPIDIDYEAAHEENIVSVISRLDEIGDLVDGEINDDELAEMIGRMSD